MKEIKSGGRESPPAHPFKAGLDQLTNGLHRPWGGSARRLQVDLLMKIRVYLGLCVILGASCISVRASDNPAQAAARVALEQKLSQSDAWDPQPLTPAVTTPSVAVVEPPVKSAANATGTVSGKVVVPASTTPLVAATPGVASPDMLFLLLSLMIISFLTMSFLLLRLLRQNSRAYDSDQASTSSRI
ncbi:MAG: hypothetical protein WAO02_15965 [Verrucomicrobiia bacterium]